MKKILLILLSIIIVTSNVAYGIAENNDVVLGLSDISNHWGEKYIKTLVARGGISGYPDGTFRPNNTITKAEFVAIALRSALNGKVADNSGEHWASGIFKTAAENKILSLGTGDFKESEWDKPITRFEMAYIIVRIAENILGELEINTDDVEKIMSDYQDVRANFKYRYYVEQAFMKGLITGKTKDGLFDGLANGTRAEAATMIVRMLDKSMREEIEINKILQSRETNETTTESTETLSDNGELSKQQIMKNIDWIVENLGFQRTTETSAMYNPINRSIHGSIISIGTDPREIFETVMTFKGWKPDEYLVGHENIQPLAKQLFNYYFPTKGNEFYNLIDGLYEGKNLNYMDKILYYDNRAVYIDGSGYLKIYIGPVGRQIRLNTLKREFEIVK